MVTTLLAEIGMVLDLLTGGDPTLPAALPDLAPLARFLAALHDLIVSLA